jgi:hypothetical protein
VLDGVFSEAGDTEIEFHEACELAPGHISQPRTSPTERASCNHLRYAA